MKRLVLLLLLELIPVGLMPTYANLYSLTVEVHELRNNDGEVVFALYNEDGTIPDEKYKRYYLAGTSAISNNTARYVFSDLPKGIYAVNILHDENKNGKIDKRFFIPKEGIGFSNYESIGLRNKPNFKDAGFALDSTMTIAVKIIYM